MDENDEFDWSREDVYMEITDKEYHHTKNMMYWGGVAVGILGSIVIALVTL